MAGKARHGDARRGKARLGRARLGTARQARQGWARRGVAWQGEAGKKTAGTLQRPRPDQTTNWREGYPIMAEISLKRIERSVAVVTIEGTAPLIVHAWSQKAKHMMLAAQQGKKAPKELKDPAADFKASQYRFADGGHGFPAMAFKSATVRGGGRAFGKAVKMTELRQHLTFLPDGFGTDGQALARLTCDEPTQREDMVRVGMGTADIRYRAMYTRWAVDLRIEFLPSVIDLGTIVALVDAGGSNGVGEWRPEKNGSFGTFRVTGEVAE